MRVRKRRWIQKATRSSRPGALHRALKVPLGKRIPFRKLRRAAKASGKLGRRARLAITLRRLAKRRRH
jgi:hypothetical protein